MTAGATAYVVAPTAEPPGSDWQRLAGLADVSAVARHRDVDVTPDDAERGAPAGARLRHAVRGVLDVDDVVPEGGGVAVALVVVPALLGDGEVKAVGGAVAGQLRGVLLRDGQTVRVGAG